LAALLGLFCPNLGLTPKRIGFGKPTLKFGGHSVRLARQCESHEILFICPKDFIALIEANLAGGVAIAFNRTCQL